MSKTNGRKLRIAAVIRVSTERQEEQGESLRTQQTQNTRDAELIGGEIVAWYGGQEHATPGYETAEVDRIIADAAKGIFDAVIVAHADRWSRGNERADNGLELFKRHRIRFFVSTTEYDLFNPEHRLFLGMSSTIGRFQAANQVKKSILNRIHRAKRGLPTTGKLPFGRTFDATTEQWGIDPAKQAMVADAARRYLAGEPLPKIAAEYGINHSNLHKVLTKRAGPEWEQEFICPDLNIREKVITPVPALLPPETIKAIAERARANRTYNHGEIKHRYLLARMVFCAHCGYAMFGQTLPNGHRYYRHAHASRVNPCPRKAIWCNADDLEQAVFGELFACFGNAVAVQRAIDAAIPNRTKIAEHRQRQDRIKEELAKLRTAREKIVRLVSKGTVSEEEAEKELDQLRERQTELQEELRRLDEALANLPDPKEVERTARRVQLAMQAKIAGLNHFPDAVSPEDRLALARMVFSGKTIDGKRMGVYLQWRDGQEERRRKRWTFHITGHLIETWGVSDCPADEEAIGAPHQRQLLSCTTSALY